MGRSILAVVVGFIVIGVLAIGTDAVVRTTVPQIFSATGRVDSVPWLALMQAYVFVYAVFGCWLTARLAPNRPMRHAIVLGLLGLAFNLVGTTLMWAQAPAWYHLVALVLVMPAAWLGGRIRERQLDGSTIPPIPRSQVNG
jgi:hypothetical protein